MIMTGKLKAYLLVTSEILTCSVVTNYVQTREPPFFKKIYKYRKIISRKNMNLPLNFSSDCITLVDPMCTSNIVVQGCLLNR